MTAARCAVRSKRPMFLAWALAWLCCLVSLDALHLQTHALESGEHSHCLVCQVGHSPTTAPARVDVVSLSTPKFAVEARAFVFPSVRPLSTVWRARVPRGPPGFLSFA